MEKVKQYKADHEKVKVYCPCCKKLMRGWTYTADWDKYWIGHVRPNRSGNECWATAEQMKPIIKQWEQKYELVERDEVS